MSLDDAEKYRKLLEHSSKYEKLFDELNDVEEYKRHILKLSSVDVNAELSRFLSRQKRFRFTQSFTLRLAGVFIVLLLSTVVFLLANYKIQEREVSPAVVLSETVNKSLHKGATLILSDGTSIDLNKNRCNVLEKDGSSISSSAISLCYNATNSNGRETFNKVVVARGQEYLLLLSDGTRVWMNSQSEMYFPVNFNGNERRVKLSGEAFFDVSHTATNAPFIVDVDAGFSIRVLGTSFNVKAYNSESSYETTLLRGRVEVENAFTGHKSVLMPSEQLLIDSSGEETIQVVDAEQYAAWRQGWFSFEGASLEKVMQQLSRMYNVEIRFLSSKERHIKVTGKLQRFEDLSVIVGMLQQITGANIHIYDGEIVVGKAEKRVF